MNFASTKSFRRPGVATKLSKIENTSHSNKSKMSNFILENLLMISTPSEILDICAFRSPPP